MSTPVMTRGFVRSGPIGSFALAGCLVGLLLPACSRGSAPEVATKNAAPQTATHDKDEDEHAEHAPAAGHATKEGEACPFHHAGQSLPPNEPLPDTSLYQLTSTWTDQTNHAFSLPALRGAPVVVAMFYGTCRSVCPVLVEDMKRLEGTLNAQSKAKTHFVLVTFDPARDTPAVLENYAKDVRVDTTRWHLISGTEEATRELANVIGVQYRKTSDGGFAHSSQITLLDRNGTVANQVVGLRQPLAELAGAVNVMAGL